MGTRGIIGWINKDGRVQGSYNHYDSYPTSLGVDMQKQLTVADGNWLPLSAVQRWVTATTEITPEDEARLTSLALWNSNVSTGRDWYAALRNQQGRMDLMCKYGYALDGSNFAEDSLFCEWGYLLDERSHEVVILRGFNTDQKAEAPYCKTDKPYTVVTNSTYYGCRELWRGTAKEFIDLDMKALEDKTVEADEADEAASA